ncbi:DUF5959 family protein [Micromonospora coerulea]|uniref:DUF5959 family protein n=1 Tax=Micromonospora coerulea TaxID=47856 RepID=UPI0019081272|nr:DUF5959 family protein [Micromonospora veneta]
MSEARPVELIRLADEENSVIVRVLGRLEPGILAHHDYLRAEIVVHSGFARGQLAAPLARHDLDDWERALDVLEAGQSVRWMDDGRNPEIQVERTDNFQYVEVVVIDPVMSMTSVRLAVCLPDGWLADLRDRLQLVRRTWPSEVIETPYGALAWRT